jgi:predicted nuclease of predicted toxin-antitoxin system
MNPQIVADESVDFRIILQLRKIGLNIYSIAESQPSLKDEVVLAIAHGKEALLITEDKDFGELVFRLQLPHRGVLLVKIADAQKKIPSVVEAISEHYTKMLNKFCVIDSTKLRIKD